MSDKKVLLIELEGHFKDAASALRCAWRLCKNNGMESTAKEIADTVLDVEEAHHIVQSEIEH